MLLVFGGECYYGSGGANDFLFSESAQSLDVVIERAESLIGMSAITHYGDDEPYCDDIISHDIEWFHVFDTELSKIVHKSKETPLGGGEVIEISNATY